MPFSAIMNSLPLRRFICLLLLFAGESAIGQVKLPSDVRMQLGKQADFLHQFAMRYTAKYEIYSNIVESGHFVTDSNQLLFRQDMLRTDTNKKVTTVQSFDGHVFDLGTPSLNTPLVLRLLGENVDDPQAARTWVKTPFLAALGIHAPSSATKCLEAGVEPLVLYLDRIGKLKNVRTDGDLVSLTFDVPEEDFRPARVVELSLSKRFNYALANWKEKSEKGVRIQDVQCSDFQEVAPAIWYAAECQATAYVADLTEKEVKRRRAWKYSIRIDDFATDTSGVDFVQEGGVGSVIAERSTEASKDEADGTIEYKVPEDYLRLASIARALYLYKLQIALALGTIGVIWAIRKKISDS